MIGTIRESMQFHCNPENLLQLLNIVDWHTSHHC